MIVLILFVSGCGIIDSVKEKKCEWGVKKQIPNEFTLESSSGDWNIVEEDRRWKDGSVMGKMAIYYRKGTEPDKNSDYYYPALHLGTIDPVFTYEKIVNDEEGTVLKRNVAFISLILMPIPETLNTSGWYATQDFKVIEFNFTRCHWLGY